MCQVRDPNITAVTNIKSKEIQRKLKASAETKEISTVNLILQILYKFLALVNEAQHTSTLFRSAIVGGTAAIRQESDNLI